MGSDRSAQVLFPGLGTVLPWDTSWKIPCRNREQGTPCRELVGAVAPSEAPPDDRSLRRASSGWSRQAVSASTSAGSTAGTRAIRSWLRPQLAVRLGVDDPVRAQRRRERQSVHSEESKSMVATTFERNAGSATNGRATAHRSAQPYRIPADSAVRLVAHARPPWARSHFHLLRREEDGGESRGVVGLRPSGSSRSRSPGFRNAGTYRPDSLISYARAIAAGESTASHNPPSAASAFCGAKLVHVRLADVHRQSARRGGRRHKFIRASGSAPATRRTGTATPVEVSLCGVAYTSTPGSAASWEPSQVRRCSHGRVSQEQGSRPPPWRI